MALTSIFVDGSTRGRAPRAAHHIAVTPDARGAYFAAGRYWSETAFYHLAFDDGAVTRLAQLGGDRVTVAVTSRGVALASRSST